MEAHPKTNKPVTIADIAKAVQLGSATVSRALSGHEHVKEETRKRILKKADEMGYVPDPQFKAFANRRWKDKSRSAIKLAIVRYKNFPTSGKQQKKSYRRLMFDTIKVHAERLGVLFDIFDRKTYSNEKAFITAIHHSGSDGLIIETTGPKASIPFSIDNYATVLLGEESSHQELHTVGCDWTQVIQLATEKAIEMGYKRIGHLIFKHENTNMDIRIQGAISHLRTEDEHKAYFTHPYHYPRLDHNIKTDYKVACATFKDWYKEARPDCIIDGNVLSHWFIKDLQEIVAKDLGRIYLRNIPTKHAPDFNYIDHNHALQAEWALQLLLQQISMGKKGIPKESIRLMVPPSFHTP